MPLDSILGPDITRAIAYATAILSAFALLYGFAKIAWTKLSGRPFPDNRLTRALDALAELGTNVLGFVNKAKRGDGSPLIPNPEVVRRDALIAELRATLDGLAVSLPVLAEKQGALDVSATRPSVAPPAPTPADGVDRATLVPPPPGVAHPAQLFAPRFDATVRQEIAPEVVDAVRARDDGQRGSVDVRTLLAVVVGLAVVLPLGVALCGCPASRQLTRPALGDVDGCEPRATRCSPTGRPQVCSGSRRWTDADNVCALGVNVAAVCCLTRSPVTGAELHACVLAERCLAQDGGL